MKKTRKTMALIMAMTLALSIFAGLTAGAEPAEPGKITITAPDSLTFEGLTFEAYKVFNVLAIDLTTHGEPTYGYEIVPAFKSFEIDYENTENPAQNFKIRAGTNDLFEFLSREGSAKPTSLQMEILADALRDFALKTPAITPEGGPRQHSGQDNKTMVIDNLPLGYYLVLAKGLAPIDGYPGSDPLVTPPVVVTAFAALTTTTPETTIKLKADAPSIEKWIKNDHEGDWDKWNDVSIGDIVDFKFESTVPTFHGYDSYIYNIHDKMDDSLDFIPGSVKVWMVADSDPDEVIPLVIDVDYKLLYPLAPETGKTFTIEFVPSVFVTYEPGTIFTTYSATLNAKAIIGQPGNFNKVWLQYSNNPHDGGTGETPPSPVVAYTGAFSFIKVEQTGVDDQGVPILKYLVNAEFELYKEVDDGTNPATLEAIWFELVENIDDIAGQVGDSNLPSFANANIYIVSSASREANGASKTLKTPAAGPVVLLGLGASAVIDVVEGVSVWDDLGVYWLHETKPPVGYFELMEPIYVQLKITAGLNGHLLNGAGTLWEYFAAFDEDFLDIFESAVNVPLTVRNHPFVGEFPGTGSIGDTILFIGSMLLMGISVIGLLVFATKGRKRVSKSKS